MFHSNIIMYLQYINIGITWLANYGCEAYMSNICKSLFAAVYNFNSTGSVTHALARKFGNSVGLWYDHLLVHLSLVPLLQMKLILIYQAKNIKVYKNFFFAMVQIYLDKRLENRDQKKYFLRFLGPSPLTTDLGWSQQVRRVSVCRNTLEQFPIVLCKLCVSK